MPEETLSIVAASALFLLYWLVFFFVYGRSDEVGYSVAFGNVRGIKLGRQQRLRRLFNIWLPHISSMFILPLTMAYVYLRMAESLGDGLAAEVCTLFAYLLLTSGLLSLLAITNNVVTLIRRVRAGKMGFVDADPPARPDQ